tara:strand:- start:1812 stop:2039 length:228 start_codon:yes stop_codon:yes gene_type:complete
MRPQDAHDMSAQDAQRLGARLARARVERKRREVADEADALPGVSAHVEGDAVVLEGRGLLDRWLRDASLRNIGRV